MTFLNPSILLGLLAASIPIILHFLNLRKLKKVEFSTLIFLKELQKSKIRKIKLKQWLLLLLRVLIIISLVIAFARPAIKSDWISSSTSKTTAVFIIDNTFSMSVITNEGSYLNKSKQLAKELINNFKSGDEIAVIPFVPDPNLQTKPSSDFGLVLKEIDNIQTAYMRKTLNDALISAGIILYESKNFNKEIYLLTDLQSGSFYQRESQLSNLSELLKNSKLFYIDLNKKTTINLGIDSIKLNTQIFEKNKQINFQASVKNHSDANGIGSVVSLFLNNKKSAQQSITLSSGESKEIFFESTLNDTGFLNASVELEDDDIIPDNKRFVSFYVPNKIKVLLIYENIEDLKFVRLVFNNPALNNFQVSELNILQLPSHNLQKYDAIVLAANPVDNSVQQIKSFIENGKGLLFFPSSNGNINFIQNFFERLELPKPDGFIGKQNSSDTPAQFEKIDFNHPLFSNLFEDKSKTKLESPEIYYYMKFNPGIRGKNIISMFDKSSFLSEFKVGSGKVLVFNISPVLGWSSFPLKSIFPALLSKNILYLSSQNKEEQNILCGDEIFIHKPTSNQLKVIYPNDVTELINVNAPQNQNYIRFANTGLIGTYRFYSGNQLIDYNSVNHDPGESTTEYYSVSALENYLEKIGVKENLVILEDSKNFAGQIYNSRFGTELWKYFIIAALLFALIEMFVAKSSRKEIEQIKN